MNKKKKTIGGSQISQIRIEEQLVEENFVFLRNWTPLTRKEFRAGRKLIDDGTFIEAIVGIVKEFCHG